MGFSEDDNYSKYSRCSFQSSRTIAVYTRMIMVIKKVCEITEFTLGNLREWNGVF